MSQFTITIQRVVKEEYQVVLDGDNAMQAFDQARSLVEARRKRGDPNHYAVIKVETKENK